MPMITKLSAAEASPCVCREYSREAGGPSEKVQCPPLNGKLWCFIFIDIPFYWISWCKWSPKNLANGGWCLFALLLFVAFCT